MKVYFRIKKERIMTYTYLRIESTKSHTQALCSSQSLLNTVLQSRLKKCLELSTKRPSFCILSEALGLKKNKIDSTESLLIKQKIDVFAKPKHFKKTITNFFVNMSVSKFCFSRSCTWFLALA